MFETVDKRTGEVTKWVPIFNAMNPCPICGKPTGSRKQSYCCASSCGTMVCCGHAIEGGRRLGKAGRIFQIDGKQPAEAVIRNFCKRKRTAASMMSVIAIAAQQAGMDRLPSLARKWGVSTDALLTCGIGCIQGVALERLCGLKYINESVWTIPMYSPEASIIGIRLRPWDLSMHYSVPGSANGLFGPVSMVAGLGPGDTVVVTEGASDTVAMHSMGFFAIGKSCARTCTNEIVALLKGRGIRAVVVRDNDRDGIQGAAETTAALRRAGVDAHTISAPDGAKDVRASKAPVDHWQAQIYNLSPVEP